MVGLENRCQRIAAVMRRNLLGIHCGLPSQKGRLFVIHTERGDKDVDESDDENERDHHVVHILRPWSVLSFLVVVSADEDENYAHHNLFNFVFTTFSLFKKTSFKV